MTTVHVKVSWVCIFPNLNFAAEHLFFFKLKLYSFLQRLQLHTTHINHAVGTNAVFMWSSYGSMT